MAAPHFSRNIILCEHPFGRVVEKAKPLNPSTVEAVGFLLADKKAGPFKLEVAWIKGTPKAGK